MSGEAIYKPLSAALLELVRIVERSKQVMTPDGAAYKALIPNRFVATLTLAADALDDADKVRDVERYVAERRESIRKGARRSDHRFKP